MAEKVEGRGAADVVDVFLRMIPLLAAQGIQMPTLQLGLPDHFIDHGDQKKLLSLAGLDAPGIEASIRARFPAAVANRQEAAK